MVDVRALPGVGYQVTPDGAMVTILDPAAVVNFELYAVVQGTNTSFADEQISGIHGKLLNTVQGSSALTGNLGLPPGEYVAKPFPCYNDPFAFSTNAPIAQDLNGDGLKDIGGLADATTTGWFTAVASPAAPNTAMVQNWTLGTFNYGVATVPADGLGTEGDRVVDAVVTWAKRNSTTAIGGKIDNISITSSNVGTYLSVGPGVQITHLVVPEPSTLILLGMSALALIFIRRRK
jgi:hypothetical protein